MFSESLVGLFSESLTVFRKGSAKLQMLFVPTKFSVFFFQKLSIAALFL